jgi:hypothetical protein
MRLSEKTFPIIKGLNNGNPDFIKIDACYNPNDKSSALSVDHKMLLALSTTAIALYKTADNFFYLTKPFLTAIEKASVKIQGKLLHYENQKPSTGVFLVENAFVAYTHNPESPDIKFTCICFNRECLTSFGVLTKDRVMHGAYPERQENGKFINNLVNLNHWMNSLLTVIYFIQNCQTETKVCLPGKKIKHNSEGIMNESQKKITVLDCKWFTDLMRDIPFGVTGHLRWQPCGKGLQMEKLIWIADYKKNGYHRKATVSRIRADENNSSLKTE